MKKRKPKARPARKPAPKAETPPDGFWRKKSIEELAAEQGVSLEGQFERALGSGKHLWKDDAELEAFLAGIRERRRRGG